MMFNRKLCYMGNKKSIYIKLKDDYGFDVPGSVVDSIVASLPSGSGYNTEYNLYLTDSGVLNSVEQKPKRGVAELKAEYFGTLPKLPHVPGQIIVTSYVKLFKYRERGRTGDVLFAVCYGGAGRKEDYKLYITYSVDGRNWSELVQIKGYDPETGTEVSPKYGYGICAAYYLGGYGSEENKFYIFGDGWVFVSHAINVDLSVDWYVYDMPLQVKDVAFYITPSGGGRNIVLGIDDRAYCFSRDNCVTWTTIEIGDVDPDPDSRILGIAALPDPTVMYAASIYMLRTNGIYKSTDGIGWSKISALDLDVPPGSALPAFPKWMLVYGAPYDSMYTIKFVAVNSYGYIVGSEDSGSGWTMKQPIPDPEYGQALHKERWCCLAAKTHCVESNARFFVVGGGVPMGVVECAAVTVTEIKYY